tara:strand:+ start:952 stop:2154 length:1203 start_codon:yes stop_codon:yes gene_type:complete
MILLAILSLVIIRWTGTGEQELNYNIKILMCVGILTLFTILLLFIINPKKFINHLVSNYKNYIVLFSTIIILLFISELSLSLFSLMRSSQEENISSYYVENHEFNYTVYLNSDHFRDGEFSKEKRSDTFRIFLIGDSFVFGAGVKQENTFDNLLEKKCRNVNCDVFNLGIAGISPSDYLKIAKQFKDYDPDLVILSLYVGNDIETETSFLSKVTTWLNSLQIVKYISSFDLHNCSYPWVKDYNIDKFYEDLMCSGRINPWITPGLVLNREESFKSLVTIFDSDPTTKNNMMAIKETYKTVPFILLINPSKFQINDVYFKEYAKMGFTVNGRVVGREMQDVIISWANKNKIDYIDLYPRIKGDLNESFYYNIDGHYNDRGNYLVVEEIYNQLEKKGLIKNT